MLSGLEETGRTRRGYFIEGLGAAQFATPATVDRLRTVAADAQSLDRLDNRVPPVALTLAATDPANPYGAALGWPALDDERHGGHRPGRKAGALVVLVDGALGLFVERGGKTVLNFLDDETLHPVAARSLADTVRRTGGRMRVEKIDGAFAVGTPLGDALVASGFAPTPQGLRLRG